METVALRDRGNDHRLGVLGQAGGQTGLSLGGIAVTGSLEQVGDNRLLRGEAQAARVGEAKTACGNDDQQKQHQENLEARVAMATTDLGLLAVLLNHLGLGQGEEAGVRGVGHKLTGSTRGVERVDGGSIHRGSRRRGHGRLGRKRGEGIVHAGKLVGLLGRELVDAIGGGGVKASSASEGDRRQRAPRPYRR